MLIAEDGRQPSIGHITYGAAAQSGKCWTDPDPKYRAKIDKTKYIVVDQDPSQRRPLAQNLIANCRQHHIQVEPHNRELNHCSIIAPFQQNLAAVDIPLQLSIEDFYHHRRTVELLHSNRHVTIVNKKPLVWFWSERRRMCSAPPKSSSPSGNSEISFLNSSVGFTRAVLEEASQALCCIGATKAQFAPAVRRRQSAASGEKGKRPE